MHTTAQPLHVILREQLLCVLYGQFWCAGIRECLTLIMSTETSVSWRQMRLHGKSESKDHASKSQLTLSNCNITHFCWITHVSSFFDFSCNCYIACASCWAQHTFCWWAGQLSCWLLVMCDLSGAMLHLRLCQSMYIWSSNTCLSIEKRMVSTLQERTHRRGCTKSCRGSRTRQKGQRQEEKVTDVVIFVPIIIESQSSPCHLGHSHMQYANTSCCQTAVKLIYERP